MTSMRTWHDIYRKAADTIGGGVTVSKKELRQVCAQVGGSEYDPQSQGPADYTGVRLADGSIAKKPTQDHWTDRYPIFFLDAGRGLYTVLFPKERVPAKCSI